MTDEQMKNQCGGWDTVIRYLDRLIYGKHGNLEFSSLIKWRPDMNPSTIDMENWNTHPVTGKPLNPKLQQCMPLGTPAGVRLSENGCGIEIFVPAEYNKYPNFRGWAAYTIKVRMLEWFYRRFL